MTDRIRHDTLGDIIIRRVSRARGVSVRLNLDGDIVVTTGKYTPLYFIRRMLDSSADTIRTMAEKAPQRPVYRDGDTIGQTHHLEVSRAPQLAAHTTASIIHVNLPDNEKISSTTVQSFIRDEVKKVLRKEARTYLEARLAVLAERYDFHYKKVRLTHAGTRWGSCSTTGTISLNIALMKLPLELIDYVLIHELCHTREMNHSRAFWQLVRSCLPAYKSLRDQLSRQTPAL